MHITCSGVNYKTANLEIREQLAFSEDSLRAALARLGCGAAQAGIHEMVILSTCNRTEIYTASPQLITDEIEAFLSATRGLALEEIHPNLYHLQDEAAAAHLFNVAAGLDSQVLGEPQILGQATRALELARGQATAGAVLSRLFQAAIHAGKRARSETQISRNPTSIASLAARLSEQVVQDLEHAQVVVLGAGEMAELAVEALRKRNARRILVINRTQENARMLADRWQAEADVFENLTSALRRADVLISSTGAPHMVIQPEQVAEAMGSRPVRPLIMIDIAVPRDIDPQVVAIPHVHLYDIDQLNEDLEAALGEREEQIPLVEEILGVEIQEFMKYLESLELLPLIADLHQKAEQIRQSELEKTLRRMPELSSDECQRIEAMSRSLVKKLLHSPTMQLRTEAAYQHSPEYASLVRSLFNLPENTPGASLPGNGSSPGSQARD